MNMFCENDNDYLALSKIYRDNIIFQKNTFSKSDMTECEEVNKYRTDLETSNQMKT